MSDNFLNNFNFKNELVFILGGSGLIGSEISKTFLDLGAKIVILDLLKPSFKNLPNKSFLKFKNFNCAKLQNFDIFFSNLFKKYGCPKIFINCSYPQTKDWNNNNFSSIKLSSYRKNIDMHLNSYAWSSKIIAEEMSKKNIKGSIILLSSIYGVVAQDPNLYDKTNINLNMTYSIIKGGIVNLTRQMASNYGTKKIRVNSVSPGGVLDKNQFNNNLFNVFKKNYSKRVPLGRLAKPEEVSNPIIFLASDASAYITGTNLLVDGGWTSI